MATLVDISPPTFDILLEHARQQADDAVSYENWLRRHEHEEATR